MLCPRLRRVSDYRTINSVLLSVSAPRPPPDRAHLLSFRSGTLASNQVETSLREREPFKFKISKDLPHHNGIVLYHSIFFYFYFGCYMILLLHRIQTIFLLSIYSFVNHALMLCEIFTYLAFRKCFNYPSIMYRYIFYIFFIL